MKKDPVLKVALLSTFDQEGGASLAALRLHKGLRLLGHDSWMVVKCKSGRDPQTVQVRPPKRETGKGEGWFHSIEERYYTLNRTALSNTRFSLPYPGYDVSRAHAVQHADIVNLHWVAHFQSVESVASLMQSGKPVVWTLHDMNPFSGGCHYSAGCMGYRHDCSDCPQLRENPWQLPARILQRKKQLWRHGLTIVTPSRWLAGCARQSSVFRDSRVEVIPNSLETDVFIPRDKADLKERLGFNREQILLLFSAYSEGEKRKGFKELQHALRHALQNPRFRELASAGRIGIINLGPVQNKSLEGGLAVRNLGIIDDLDRIAAVYAAADIFVMPSLEENLANVMLEALACATPVLAFDVGGTPDVVRDGVTGYLAPAFACDQLGQRLLELVFNPTLREEMGRNGRLLIEGKFALSNQAANYTELFRELSVAGRDAVVIPVAQDVESEANELEWLENLGAVVQEDFASEMATLLPKHAAWHIFKDQAVHNLRAIRYLLKGRGALHTFRAVARKLWRVFRSGGR